MRADVLVAGTLGRYKLVFEAAEECFRDAILEVGTWIFGYDLFANGFGKVLVSDAQHIQTNAVVEQFDLDRFVSCNSRRRVQRNRVPGCLNAIIRHTMVLQELADGIRAVYLEAIIVAAELFQKTEIMECGTDEQELTVELLSRLLALFSGPEKHPMRMVEEKRRAEFPQETRRLTRECAVRYTGLHALEF